MAKYKNSNVEKAEDVFVIKQPTHREKDFGIFWGYGGIYAEPKYEGDPFEIVMDKLGNNLLLNETQFKRIKKWIM